MWNVEWSVSGNKNKVTFNDYKDAIEFLEATVRDFGKRFKIEIKMWESE